MKDSDKGRSSYAHVEVFEYALALLQSFDLQERQQFAVHYEIETINKPVFLPLPIARRMPGQMPLALREIHKLILQFLLLWMIA